MSQNEVRTFRAATMHEALDLVRQELGPNAVILQTREVPPPRFLLWRRGKEQVEITAGTGVNVRPSRVAAQPAGSNAGTHPPQARAAGSSAAAVTAPVREPMPRQPAPRNGSSAEDNSLADPPSLTSLLGRGGALRRPSDHGVELPLDSQRLASAASSPMSGSSSGSAALSALASEQHASIVRQLNSIQKMVETLGRGPAVRSDEIPPELFQLYTELIDAEVDEELARQLTRRLTQESPAGLSATAARARLSSMVESELNCAPGIRLVPGERKVVALVGPTGVGKTTTLAKLAANFRLRDGLRMGLVTVDTYRVAAVEQLRTYAEIIDLPMKVVTSPRDMRRALDELQGLDLVLIDTAGRSPRDDLKIQELKSLLAEARVDEVHLVLSLVASARSLEATAEKFAPAGPTSMILTKLDEAVGMGMLMSVARRVPLPVSYLTTGQDVPDDIEPAQARRMARLVLGEENLSARQRAAT